MVEEMVQRLARKSGMREREAQDPKDQDGLSSPRVSPDALRDASREEETLNGIHGVRTLLMPDPD